MLLFEYEVMLHYTDEAPELFGHVQLEKIPAVGERVMLKWLDGKEYASVIVSKVGGTKINCDWDTHILVGDEE